MCVVPYSGATRQPPPMGALWATCVAVGRCAMRASAVLRAPYRSPCGVGYGVRRVAMHSLCVRCGVVKLLRLSGGGLSARPPAFWYQSMTDDTRTQIHVAIDVSRACRGLYIELCLGDARYAHARSTPHRVPCTGFISGVGGRAHPSPLLSARGGREARNEKRQRCECYVKGLQRLHF